MNEQVLFAKQPIIERRSGSILGYAGVDWFDLNGQREPEFGYRLTPTARGFGYATEASALLLDRARTAPYEVIYGIVHADNQASINTIGKLGFDFWKNDLVEGEPRNLYRWFRQPG